MVGVRSERGLCEEVRLNLADRWFCRLGRDGGCASALRVAHKYKGAFAGWIAAMKARKPEPAAAAALANKPARTCRAVQSTGESFREQLYVRA